MIDAVVSLRKTFSGWKHMLLWNLYIAFSTFPDVQVAPPYHQRCRLLSLSALSADNKLKGPSPLKSRWSWVNDWQKEISNFDFTSVHYKWALAQRRCWCFGICSHMASSLHGRALTCICGCVHRRGFLEVFLSPCSDFQTESGLFLMQNCLRLQKSRASINDFWPCLMHTGMTPDSFNLLMILCTVDYGKFSRCGTLF